MKRTGLVLLVLVTTIATFGLLGGCQTNPGTANAATGTLDSPTMVDTVNQLFSSYIAAVVAGAPDSWIELWDTEGVQLPPDTPMLVGRDAIYKEVKGGMKPGAVSDMKIVVQDVKTSGMIAVARGVYTITMTPAAGGGGVDGKFLTVFHQQPNGSWRIYRDCFNSNVPPAM